MRKFFQRSSAAVASGSVLLLQNANAALPTGATTAVTEAGTDAGTLGAAVLVVLIGIAAIKYLRRVL